MEKRKKIQKFIKLPKLSYLIYNVEMTDKLKNKFLKHNIEYKENIDLTQKSTFKIKSTADIFIAPPTAESLKTSLEIVKAINVPFFILGGGSNIVFPDESYKGVIISTENLKEIKTVENSDKTEDTVYIKCQAGTTVASLVKFCIDNNISGTEEFAGLPGTIGGAVYMNARCFNKSISDIFFAGSYLEADKDNKLQLMEKTFDEKEWDYKKSPFQKTATEKYIVEATFKLKQKNSSQEIQEKCKYYIKERQNKGHFKYPSAGSVFKNNRKFGKPSGQIIEEAGLKGLTIGGAEVAPFHGNFIINIDNAKANDIKELVSIIRKTVLEKYGFVLEPEIIFL